MAPVARRRTFVVGVGCTAFEKPRGRVDYPYMAIEAATKALLDAGINYDDVEQAYVGHVFGVSCRSCAVLARPNPSFLRGGGKRPRDETCGADSGAILTKTGLYQWSTCIVRPRTDSNPHRQCECLHAEVHETWRFRLVDSSRDRRGGHHVWRQSTSGCLQDS